MKDFLLNKDISEKRVGWITKVMEYDIHIKITKPIRGKSLCKQFVSSFEMLSKATLVLQE